MLTCVISGSPVSEASRNFIKTAPQSSFVCLSRPSARRSQIAEHHLRNGWISPNSSWQIWETYQEVVRPVRLFKSNSQSRFRIQAFQLTALKVARTFFGKFAMGIPEQRESKDNAEMPQGFILLVHLKLARRLHKIIIRQARPPQFPRLLYRYLSARH